MTKYITEMCKNKYTKLINKIGKIKLVLKRYLILSYPPNKYFDKNQLQSGLIGGD